MSEPSRSRFAARLEICSGVTSFLGDTRIRLLEAIAECGSIAQAAKRVPLSYKAAWDAVDAMNSLAEQPLVERSTGGRQGGGTRLTAYGLRTVALYRALATTYQAAFEQLAPALQQAGDTADLSHFQSLLRRFAMKSSARNQWVGQVVAVRRGSVDVEVVLRLDAGDELVAVITEDSANVLAVAPGVELVALVKASSVLLTSDASARFSARNRLCGQVSRIHCGPVNSEVTLALAGGKTLCAVITENSVERLGLAVGSTACALFKASAVILCRYD